MKKLSFTSEQGTVILINDHHATLHTLNGDFCTLTLGEQGFIYTHQISTGAGITEKGQPRIVQENNHFYLQFLRGHLAERLPLGDQPDPQASEIVAHLDEWRTQKA